MQNCTATISYDAQLPRFLRLFSKFLNICVEWAYLQRKEGLWGNAD
jgi:hypothetical protein